MADVATPGRDLEVAELRAVAAAEAGDAAALKAALAAGASPDCVCKNGKPLLFYASRTSLEAVTVLLAAGADVNCRLSYGGRLSLLHWLVADGGSTNSGLSLNVAEALLARRPNLEPKLDGMELTPLGYAACHGDLGLMQLLLEAGADKDATSAKNRTPLMVSIFHDRASSAGALALIAAGANVTRVDNEGESAITLVDNTDRPELYSALIAAGADVNASNGTLTPLHNAVLAGVASAKVLLAAGANPNAKTADGRRTREYSVGAETPLMGVAAVGIKNELELLELLAAAGADLDATDQNDDTVLTRTARWASHPSRGRVIVKLLELGADASLKGREGMTAAEQAELNPFNKERMLAALQGAAALNAYEAASAPARAAFATLPAAAWNPAAWSRPDWMRAVKAYAVLTLVSMGAKWFAGALGKAWGRGR